MVSGCVEAYLDLNRQAQELGWNPALPHDADWQNQLDTLHDQAA
jgi:hypothetical protein